MVFPILALAGSCILFFGYDAAVMSLVNVNPHYLNVINSAGGTDADAARVGGVVSFWFLGFLIGECSKSRYLLSSPGTDMERRHNGWSVCGQDRQTQVDSTWLLLGHLRSNSPVNCAKLLLDELRSNPERNWMRPSQHHGANLDIRDRRL
jgi:hypothetical protein